MMKAMMKAPRRMCVKLVVNRQTYYILKTLFLLHTLATQDLFHLLHDHCISRRRNIMFNKNRICVHVVSLSWLLTITKHGVELIR